MHSLDLFADVVGEKGPKSGMLQAAMRMIEEEGSGVVVALHAAAPGSLSRSIDVRAGKPADFSAFDIAPFVPVHVGDDLAACRQPVKEWLALYIGGMGARGKNFYNDYASRMGYAADAANIQDLYLAGKKAEAAAAVPDKLVDTVALVGPPARIRERLQVWKAAGARGSVGTLILMKANSAGLRVVAEGVLG